MGLESIAPEQTLHLFKHLFSENFIFVNGNQKMKEEIKNSKLETINKAQSGLFLVIAQPVVVTEV